MIYAISIACIVVIVSAILLIRSRVVRSTLHRKSEHELEEQIRARNHQSAVLRFLSEGDSRTGRAIQSMLREKKLSHEIGLLPDLLELYEKKGFITSRPCIQSVREYEFEPESLEILPLAAGFGVANTYEALARRSLVGEIAVEHMNALERECAAFEARKTNIVRYFSITPKGREVLERM